MDRKFSLDGERRGVLLLPIAELKFSDAGVILIMVEQILTKDMI